MIKSNNRIYKKITLPISRDERGYLSFCEANNNIPIDIKRVYFMGDLVVKGNRGHHAHKVTRQILFCLHGSAKIKLDDGETKEEIILDKPNIGITIENKIWHSMENFSKGTIIMVLASEYYDEKDYLRDYKEFKKFIKK